MVMEMSKPWPMKAHKSNRRVIVPRWDVRNACNQLNEKWICLVHTQLAGCPQGGSYSAAHSCRMKGRHKKRRDAMCVTRPPYDRSSCMAATFPERNFMVSLAT